MVGPHVNYAINTKTTNVFAKNTKVQIREGKEGERKRTHTLNHDRQQGKKNKKETFQQQHAMFSIGYSLFMNLIS